MLEIRELVKKYQEEKSGLPPKVVADLNVYLQTVVSLNRGVDSMHDGEDGFALILGSQTDIEEDLYKNGVSRDDLNKLSGVLLGVED